MADFQSVAMAPAFNATIQDLITATTSPITTALNTYFVLAEVSLMLDCTCCTSPSYTHKHMAMSWGSEWEAVDKLGKVLLCKIFHGRHAQWALWQLISTLTTSTLMHQSSDDIDPESISITAVKSSYGLWIYPWANMPLEHFICYAWRGWNLV